MNHTFTFMHPWIGRLIVTFVLCLICFIAYSSQIFIIWPWYGRVLSVELLYLLAPFNILVGLLLWNYFLCVNTDPGRVPVGWKPDISEDGLEVKKLTGRPRYCRICNGYKPPRAHHCKQCHRCVLKMDHHCPWINNCVGHFNYASFIRFLFYVDVACTYHIIMVTSKVFDITKSHYWDDPSSLELIMIIMNYVACIPVLLAVGGFSIYHLYLLLSNTTTIEGWEKGKISLIVKRGTVHEIKFPYDLGMIRNIDSVLGPNFLLWCWPRQLSDSGLKFDLSEKDGEVCQQEQPSSPSPRSPDLQSTSPWTFENGDFNPALQPSNESLRQATSVARKRQRSCIPEGADSSDVPPYHPDYDRGNENGLDEEDSPDEDANYSEARVRRGSEGYEVRQINREDMLRRYLEELGEKEGRYVKYIPQPDSDVDDDGDEDNVPLAYVAGQPTTSN